MLALFYGDPGMRLRVGEVGGRKLSLVAHLRAGVYVVPHIVLRKVGIGGNDRSVRPMEVSNKGNLPKTQVK